MSAQATLPPTQALTLTHRALMGTAHACTGKRVSDETCGGGKPTRQVRREAVQAAAMGKSKRQDCAFVTLGHPPFLKNKHKNILFLHNYSHHGDTHTHTQKPTRA